METKTHVKASSPFNIRRHSCPKRSTAWKSERGASLVEIALLLPFLGLLLLGVIDFGRAFYLSIEVQNAAEAAALYGAQNITDTTGIENAAVNDAANVPGMSTSSVTVTTGCECSNGTSSQSPCPGTPPTCPANVVNFVQVTTSATYKPWFSSWMIPGLPSPITLNGSAKVRQQGP